LKKNLKAAHLFPRPQSAGSVYSEFPTLLRCWNCCPTFNGNEFDCRVILSDYYVQRRSYSRKDLQAVDRISRRKAYWRRFLRSQL